MKRFLLIWLVLAVAVLTGGLLSLKGRPPVLLVMTPDQYGQRLYNQGRFEEAAKWFQSSNRQGTALFRAAKFKDASGRFAGIASAEGLYNLGNALAMQGKYTDAAERYVQALELQPDWTEAEENLQIARLSAERLEQTGGEATELGADDFIFSNKKPPPSAAESTETAQKASSAQMHAVWLRQVQTRPADFLRSKFSYQSTMRQEGRQE